MCLLWAKRWTCKAQPSVKALLAPSSVTTSVHNVRLTVTAVRTTCLVLSVWRKTQENDGYVALQVTFGARKSSRVTKPMAGHLAKAGVEAGEIIQEFQVNADTAAKYAAGATVPVSDVFAVGQKVDVQGTTIGKGFAGTIKRHHFKSQRASHGNSRSHNVPGSIGMAQDPGRVFPGKRMTGHLGVDTVTTQNLDIIRIDEARQLLLVRGAVPGSAGGFVTVRPAVKAKGAN